MDIIQKIPELKVYKLTAKKIIENQKFFENKQFDELFKNKLSKFLFNNELFFIVSGKAGTGKTELLCKLAELFKHGSVVCTFTNKCVKNLQNKTNMTRPYCTTIHDLFFTNEIMENDTFTIGQNITPKFDNFFNLKPRFIFKPSTLPKLVYSVDYYHFIKNFGNKFIVLVDEASMVPSYVFYHWIKNYSDVFESSFVIKNSNGENELVRNVPIRAKFILFGDRNQLLPVEEKLNLKNQIFFSREPDIVLDKSYRTSKSSLLNLYNCILENKNIYFKKFDNKKDIILTNLLDKNIENYIRDVDMILAFKNDTCDIINQVKRQIKFKSSQRYPHIGDYIYFDNVLYDIFLFEYKEYKNQPILKFKKSIKNKNVKGSIGKIVDIQHYYTDMALIQADVLIDDMLFKDLMLDFSFFFSEGERANFFSKRISYIYSILNNEENKDDALFKIKSFLEVVPFRYAYCLTVHKAQGMEWDSVMIIHDAPNFTKRKRFDNITDYQRWLYTACTRTKKKLIICSWK